MEKNKKSDESSFAGFLKSYSKGNIAFQSQLISNYASDIEQLCGSIQKLIQEIQSLDIQTSDVNGVIMHLQNSIQLLSSIQSANAPLDNLILFAEEIDIAILNYNILKGSPIYERLVPVKKSLDIVIYNLLTLARKIGGSSLVEKAISIAEKF